MSQLARLILKLFGWQLVGKLPKQKKYVVIIGPHTSNWDFFIFFLVKIAYKLKVVFIGKHTIFIGPIGWALRKLGGLPVDRRSKHNVVDMVVNEFNQRDEIVFCLSPEGTRSYLDHWKSGFYHISFKANVPIQIAFLDTTTKVVGWGPLFQPLKDKNELLKKIALFYSNKRGFKPEKFSQIIFKSSTNDIANEKE